AALKAAEWLRGVQNADGGWGAGGEARSSIGRTACAVFGLVSGGDAGSESVRRGLDYLLAAQDADGGWDDDGWNWQLLPGFVECRSSLDALALPLMALNAFVRRSDAGSAGKPGVQG
ncbi:MAG TPA: prenyltransferase/squalene oxidase repeat-containing protein, partial [Bryobacteraceae bacterium]|nr:prenyltransferase/squalene oxidase repeat-containing protein [Bryobacteraceae bacterium]